MASVGTVFHLQMSAMSTVNLPIPSCQTKALSGLTYRSSERSRQTLQLKLEGPAAFPLCRARPSRLLVRAARSDPSKASNEGGKAAETEVEGEGKSLTVSFSQDVSTRQSESPAEEAGEEVGDAAESVVGAVQETGKVVQREVNLTAGEVGDSFEEVRSVAEQQSREVAGDLEKAARRVSDLAGEGAEDARKAIQQGGEQFQEEAQARADYFQSQANLAQREVTKQAEYAADRSEGARFEIESSGQEAARKVQDALEKLTAAAQAGDTNAIIAAAQEVVEVLNTFGQQAGQAVYEAASDTLQSVTGQALPGVTRGDREQERAVGPPLANPNVPEGGEPEEDPKPMADPGPYKDLKAFVVGAGGRTGRILAERLAGKAVPVRAFVRNARTENYLGQILGVQVLEGDIYNYGDVAEALGDSNVILCAVGVRPDPLDPLGPYKEYEGIKNLIAAAKNSGEVKKFVFVTSIGVSQLLSPFNAFWGLLFWKKQSELELQRSGIDYTIVRPGGLRNAESESTNIVMKKADSIFRGAITRGQVADVCLEALVTEEASNKVVEVVAVADKNVPYKPTAKLFSSI